jgi:hypothetical protein
MLWHAPVRQAFMMPEVCTAGDLLKSARPSLTGWYADPMDTPAAQALLDRAHRQLRSRLCRGGRCFQLYVLKMICHHWLQSDSALDFRQLSALASDDSERALVELVYGQLLISSKRQPARQHLARGFSLAARHLDTVDYLLLLRRHDLLEYLPLSECPVVAQDLQSLLKESVVISRLRGNERRVLKSSHRDTLG